MSQLGRLIKHHAAFLQAMPGTVYFVTAGSGISTLWMSRRVTRMTGFSPSQFVRDPQFWRSRLHPDDYERVIKNFVELKDVKEVQCMYRWRCADETYRWFIDRAALHCDISGTPVEIVGMWVELVTCSALDKINCLLRDAKTTSKKQP